MNACHPYQSVNYINSHDGFTLYDQVSVHHRCNWANGQGNTDGHQTNYKAAGIVAGKATRMCRPA